MPLTNIDTVTALPDAPQRGEDQDTFVSKANAFVAAQVTLATELNTSIGQMNTLGGEIEGIGNQVSSDALGASNAVTSAESARDLAQQWANEDENVVVSGGEYSAKHYSIKSESFKDSAETAAAAAQSAAGLPSLAGNAGKRLGVNSAENGVEWVPSNADYQEFTTSGTWTKPEGCNFVYVEMVGAGASGAASVSSTDGSLVRAGGEGGHFVSKLFSAADLDATEAVIIGAGGASVVAVDTAVLSGNNGGDTTFADCIAKGGLGATSNTSPLYNTTIFPPSGGAGGINDGFSGSGGGGGGGTNSGSRNGADSLKGHGSGGDGARGASPQTAGNGASPGGGGGSAKVSTGSVGTATSGAGGDGIVKVWAW